MLSTSRRTLSSVITEVKPSATVDLSARTRRYAITMAIRTACFVGMVFAPGYWGFALLLGAMLLPWLAVMLANQQDRRSTALPSHEAPTRPALTASTIVLGEVVDDASA